MVVFEGMTIDELWKNIDAEMRKRGVDNSDHMSPLDDSYSPDYAVKLVKVLGCYSLKMAKSRMLNDLLASYCIVKDDFEYYVKKLKLLLRRKHATKRLLCRLDRRLAKKRLYHRLAKK